jgi:hypothetical protein
MNNPQALDVLKNLDKYKKMLDTPEGKLMAATFMEMAKKKK